ncbi:hypothetical protein CHKEEEPN_4417 [Methylorubrum podarium]|nr:hypothetical protein CHKEEEPN_4417 [Methylorubrum podarium]
MLAHLGLEAGDENVRRAPRHDVARLPVRTPPDRLDEGVQTVGREEVGDRGDEDEVGGPHGHLGHRRDARRAIEEDVVVLLGQRGEILLEDRPQLLVDGVHREFPLGQFVQDLPLHEPQMRAGRQQRERERGVLVDGQADAGLDAGGEVRLVPGDELEGEIGFERAPADDHLAEQLVAREADRHARLRIEIDHQHPRPVGGQRLGEHDHGGGLADPALHVRHRDQLAAHRHPPGIHSRVRPRSTAGPSRWTAL